MDFLFDGPFPVFRAAFLLLLLLVPLVMIHELGHFITARLFGIKVLEFAIGFPPRVKGLVWKRGETEYTVNWLPIGGFVRLLGEEDPSDPRSLAAAAAWKRLVVIYAGVAINIVAAIALFSFGFMLPRERSLSLAQVTSVAEGSPASEAHVTGDMRDGSEPVQSILVGDLILQVEGREIKNVDEMLLANRLNLGEDQHWLINRGGSILEADVYARWSPPAGQGPTGITVGPPSTCTDVDADGNPVNCQLLYPFTETQQYWPWDAVRHGWNQLLDTVVLTKNEIQVMFAGTSGASLSGEGQPCLAGPSESLRRPTTLSNRPGGARSSNWPLCSASASRSSTCCRSPGSTVAGRCSSSSRSSVAAAESLPSGRASCTSPGWPCSSPSPS